MTKTQKVENYEISAHCEHVLHLIVQNEGFILYDIDRLGMLFVPGSLFLAPRNGFLN